MASTNPRADYGLDAPGVVRNLYFGAGVAAIILISRFFGLWNNHSTLAWLFSSLMGFGSGCLLTAWGMIWYSRVGKIRAREQLFDSLKLRGDERVLDIGCGRGLWLIAAARRLPLGRAVGIDIWNSEDLSDNAADQTWNNARAEGVAQRIELVTGDARGLPFENDRFDLVVSSAALHNIYDSRQREGAIAEVARVLKPGGRVAISDIRHVSQYARVLSASGLEARVTRSFLQWVVSFWTLGSLVPGRVLASKPGVSR